ncbi:hypothetical protein N9600_02045 [Flavobacteriaceae bacterium]|nr:hypothetical protein [Flavobacteriaceae bacterium]
MLKSYKKLILILLFIPLVSFGQDWMLLEESGTGWEFNQTWKLTNKNENLKGYSFYTLEGSQVKRLQI